VSARERIVVVVSVAAPVELVWERTQDPGLHTAWDLRFTSIEPSDARDARGYALLEYRTRIGIFFELRGWGRYLTSEAPDLSTFEFGSDDPRSLIREGRGIWRYERAGEGTLFVTVFDYEVRGGTLGRLLDRIVVRPLMQLATEWGFETLRRWCEGDAQAPSARSSRLAFARFFLARRLGRAPAPGEARSWLGTGRPGEVACR
jgi:hypothetical protein